MTWFDILFSKPEPPSRRVMPDEIAYNGAAWWVHNYIPDDFMEELDTLVGTTAEDTGFVPVDFTFNPGEPSVLFEGEDGQIYRGQDGAKRRLDVALRSAAIRRARMKALLVGQAGTGKSTLAKILAYRLYQERLSQGDPGGRYFEIFPAQVEERARLDAFMRQLEPFDTVLIDEIHTLQHIEDFFHVLDDTGDSRYPVSNGEWVMIPEGVSWLGATTDPGEMDHTTGGALRRRLTPEVELTSPDVETLKHIVLDQPFGVEEAAALAIAQRSGGLPWQAIQVYGEAQDWAVVEGTGLILPKHAKEAFGAIGLDERGLLPRDRAVITALFHTPYELKSGPKAGQLVFKMSEAALCSATGIDTITYKQRVQPKLMNLGYLTTVGGQQLTPKAVEDYGELKEAA